MQGVLADLFEGEPELWATGFQFTEGPVWVEGEGWLFSDIPASTIYLSRGKDQVEVFRKPSGESNGLTLDHQGRLLACEHANRRVSRTESDGTVVTLADRFEGKRLNAPNDIVVKSDGSIYFTDPYFGPDEGSLELGWFGVFRLTPDGALEVLTEVMERPNGLAFSPDERWLYVDDSHKAHVRRFEVTPEGKLRGGEEFVSVQAEAPGAADGMKVDAESRLYVTGPGGVWIFDSEGVHLGTLAMPEVTANLAFGEADNRTLLLTATHSVYRVRTATPGATRPGRN